MTAKTGSEKIDSFLRREKSWLPEFEELRRILLSCGLTEELKWGQPCYTLNDKNIVLIHGFKAYCALLFFKGALLKDPKQLLIQQTKNVQAARQLRFTTITEILKAEKAIRSFVKEAIALEKSGVKVALKKTSEFEMPQEFQQRLNKNKALKKAFESLTPGRQRAYLLHFSSPKQTATRVARIEKAIPGILDGLGLND